MVVLQRLAPSFHPTFSCVCKKTRGYDGQKTMR
ncbi:MAG: hypothetical protein ACI4VV_04850 [Eggerthellaceae bacterium]